MSDEELITKLRDTGIAASIKHGMAVAMITVGLIIDDEKRLTKMAKQAIAAAEIKGKIDPCILERAINEARIAFERLVCIVAASANARPTSKIERFELLRKSCLALIREVGADDKTLSTLEHEFEEALNAYQAASDDDELKPLRLWAAYYDPWDDESPFLLTLMYAIAKGTVEPLVDKIKYPLMSLDRTSALLGAMSRTAKPVDGGSYVNQNNVCVASLVPTDIAPVIPLSLMDKGVLRLLHSMPAQKILRDLPYRAVKELIAGWPKLSFGDVEIVGGLGAYAEELGIGWRNQGDIRRILNLLQFLTVHQGNRTYYGMLTWDETGASRGRRNEINIRLGRAWFAPTGSGKLVPMPNRLPPLIGRDNDKASQCVLQARAMIWMREHALQIIEHGGIFIRLKDWQALADKSGLPHSYLGKLLDRHWLDDAEDGSKAFLVYYGNDKWTLAPSYRDEWEQIKIGGKIDKNAGERGKLAAKKKREGVRKGRRWRKGKEQ